MKTANPFLYFNGNTEEAFNFYKTVFGMCTDKVGVQWMVSYTGEAGL
ncbi:MAG: hypothetical protein WED82_11820 [Balneolales bacterium]